MEPLPVERRAVQVGVNEFTADSAVETVGKTREDRLDDIRHAQEHRRELIAATFAEARATASDGYDNRLLRITSGSFRERANRTERRRQGYIERYEVIAQTEIEELIQLLNLEIPEELVLLIEKLNLEYSNLKTRLVVVEMETIVLMHRLYTEMTRSGEALESMLDRVYGRGTDRSIGTAPVLLTEIITLRAQGMHDRAIYRKLRRKYHPDVSDDPMSEEISRVLTDIYDPKERKLKF